MGDSIVQRAAIRLGCQLQVRWNGLGGARYSDVPNLLVLLDSLWPCPAMIIVHIGTNDLTSVDFFWHAPAYLSFYRGDLGSSSCGAIGLVRYPSPRLLLWAQKPGKNGNEATGS